MSLLFSKSDVRRHLSELGYANVTEEQLEDFVRDLRRLIRYEEKHGGGGRKATTTTTSTMRRCSSVSSTSSAYSSSSSLLEPDEAGNQRKRRARSAVRRSRNVVDLVDGSGVSNDDDEGNEVIVRIGVEEEEASSATDEGDSKRAVKKSGLIPLGKPTTSYITPADSASRGAVPRSKKCDPVRLHEYYSAQWARTRFPGDSSDKNVRWAVREWMVGKMG